MNSVLLPAILLGATGGVIGLILSIVAKQFEVVGEELTEELKALLPGLNCGICGYAGCENYAQSLATGEESDYSLCRPGKETAKNAMKSRLEAEGLV